MIDTSIVVVGLPDSGKSNYIGRLWLALQNKNFKLSASNPPDDIKYVEGLAEHILQGNFAPRTEREHANREFNVKIKKSGAQDEATIVIPDVTGELWQKVVETLEIPDNWLNIIRNGRGALLFVRVHSELNIQPLDFVNSRELLLAGLLDKKTNSEIPTQVALIELLRFLENYLGTSGSAKPKLAVIVSAWDLLNQDEAKNGPESYLATQFPLFSGRIKDMTKVDIKVFASSIAGGDLSPGSEFSKVFLNSDSADFGYIITKEDKDGVKEVHDITLPIDWIMS